MPEYKVIGKRIYLSRSRMQLNDDEEIETSDMAVEPGEIVELPEETAAPLSDRLELVEDEEGN